MVRFTLKIFLGLLLIGIFYAGFSVAGVSKVLANTCNNSGVYTCVTIEVRDGSASGPGLAGVTVSMNIGNYVTGGYCYSPCKQPGIYQTTTDSNGNAHFDNVPCTASVSGLQFFIAKDGYYPWPANVNPYLTSTWINYSNVGNSPSPPLDINIYLAPKPPTPSNNLVLQSQVVCYSSFNVINYQYSITDRFNTSLKISKNSNMSNTIYDGPLQTTSGAYSFIPPSGNTTYYAQLNRYAYVGNQVSNYISSLSCGPQPQITNTLNVNSSGASNVVISSNNGLGGTTNYTQTNTIALIDTLNASAVPGYTFNSWSGCTPTSPSGNSACGVSVSGGGTQTVTANYTRNNVTTNTLNVQSSPLIGVKITSASGNNNGTTNYQKTSTSTIPSDTLTAPPSALDSLGNVYTFDRWSNTCNAGSSGFNCVVSVSGGGTQTVTANYLPPGALGTPTLTPISGLPCVNSGSTYGPAVSFGWSNVSGASYDVQLSIYNQQNPPGNGDFVNPGLGGYFVYKYSISTNNTTGASGWNSAGGMPIDANNQPLKLSPGTTYYWHVRAKNSTSTGDWNSFGSFSATTCAAAVPDLVTTGDNPSPPPAPKTQITTGSAVTFSGYVQNVGTGVANPSTASIRIYDPAHNPISYIYTQGTPKLVVGSSKEFISWASSPSWTAPSTAGTNYSYQICVTPVLGETNTALNGNNCSTPILFDVVAPALDWVRTENGNVGSGGPINNLDLIGHNSSATNSNVEYIRQTTAVTGFFNSFKNWIVSTTPEPKLTSKNGTNYTGFYNELSGSNACTISGPNIPNARGRFKVAGSLTVDGSTNGTTPCGSGKDAAVIFVGGDLTINNGKIDYGKKRPTVFIVKGKITVDENIDTLDAVLINDQGFNDGLGGTDKLTIRGSIISVLNGGFGDQLILGRKSGGESEHIILQPSYFYYLTDYAGVAKTYYKEENP